MGKENMIRLHDGTVLDGYCGYSDRSLWCFVKGKNVVECIGLFTDPGKTQTITSSFTGTAKRYSGFTDFLMLRNEEEEDQVSVRMTWPEGQPHSIETIDNLPEENGSEENV